MGILDILKGHAGEFLVGLRVTLQLCLAVWGIGLILGFAVGVAGARWRRAIGIPSRVISCTLFHPYICHSLVSSGSIHALYGQSPIVLS